MAVNESNFQDRLGCAPTAESWLRLPAVTYGCYRRRPANHSQLVSLLPGCIWLSHKIMPRFLVPRGGCQAEVGSASACWLLLYYNGCWWNTSAGRPSALCLKICLGLIYDPVAGLVEVPCVQAIMRASFACSCWHGLGGYHRREAIQSIKIWWSAMYPIWLGQLPSGKLLEFETSSNSGKTREEFLDNF